MPRLSVLDIFSQLDCRAKWGQFSVTSMIQAVIGDTEVGVRTIAAKTVMNDETYVSMAPFYFRFSATKPWDHRDHPKYTYDRLAELGS